MNKILITGSYGFIGSNVNNRLCSDLPEVVITTIEETDLTSKKWVSDIENRLKSSEPQVIFHIGACSNTLESDVNYIMQRNYEFTKIVTNYAQENKVPLIYSSSAANYGVSGTYPSNLYGWSKYTAEDYVVKSGGVALRYFNVYGPGEENKGAMSSFAYQAFVKNKTSGRVCLFPGKPLRDFVHVSDVVEANIFAMRHYSTLMGKYYEVGTSIASSFEDIMLALGIDFEYTSEEIIPFGYQNYTCSKPEKWMPGWSPSINLQEGINTYKEYLQRTYI